MKGAEPRWGLVEYHPPLIVQVAAVVPKVACEGMAETM
jgi:hypothetical protein